MKSRANNESGPAAYKRTGKGRIPIKQLKPLLYIGPALCIYLFVIVIPTFYTMYISLLEWNGVSLEKVFVGLKNYINLFTRDNVFLISFKKYIDLDWIIVSNQHGIAAVCFALNRNLKEGFFRAAALFSAYFIQYCGSNHLVLAL